MRGGKQVGDGWKEVQNEAEERTGPAAIVCSPRHQAVKVTATISRSASLKSSFTEGGGRGTDWIRRESMEWLCESPSLD